MRTTRNSAAPRTPVLAMAAILCLAGTGCRDASAPEGLQAHRVVADRVSRAMDDLQKRRASLEADADIRDAMAGLNVMKEPPAPAPEPVVAPEPDEASADSADPAADSPDPAPAVFRLQGIAWHPTAPLAIVNKRTVGVGETVDGRRVESITREGAVLVGPDGDRLELRLYEPGSKQP